MRPSSDSRPGGWLEGSDPGPGDRFAYGDMPAASSPSSCSSAGRKSDGSVAINGLAIRLYRDGEGAIIRDAGWVRAIEDGLVVRGPHPFLEPDPADVYC